MVAKSLIERRAVIDLGTNTFNLLVADIKSDRIAVVHTERIPVMIGMGGINKGFISEDAMSRAKQALRIYCDECRKLGVQHILGFGTSAIRDAKNRSELIDFANQELGLTIRAISGEQEADLIFKGVSWVHDFSIDPAVIMDIGGGSTEFIEADKDGINSLKSLNIGVSRIFQELGKPAEFDKNEIRQVYDFLDQYTEELAELKGPGIMIGASGTFETFFEMIFEMPYGNPETTIELPIEKLKEVLQWSIHSSYKERLDHPWVTDIRKSMLPIAAIKVHWAIETLNATKVLVSPYSLKEGALNWINL